ncbi:sensor histidine kinase [Micromonospora purpureochromogenes]|uniref:sensor histidine kinase n=1 Tax=Micromonospora purpureochromogenes TaxID=47872 RepID=UPI0012FDFFF3|nr:HAMP domain-containing sensor histidine kinase [Micromonospora purpureochromogenes]
MRARHGNRKLVRRWRPAGPDHGGSLGEPADPGLMLRVLCHELRTPVSSLASLTRALAEDTGRLPAEERRAISELARQQAAHLDGLLRAVTAGGGALTPAARPDRIAPLADLVPVVVALVPPHRLRTRVTRPAGGCPVPARRTRQVLVNLVQNALRHGPADGEVGLYAAVRPAGLSILVTDQGRSTDGLAEALRRPTPGGGMHGLGLWITRQLVAADGGSVRAHRLRPRGVGVEVLLPGDGRQPG